MHSDISGYKSRQTLDSSFCHLNNAGHTEMMKPFLKEMKN